MVGESGRWPDENYFVGGQSGDGPPSCIRRRRKMLIKKINLAQKPVTSVATYVPPVEN